MSRANEDFGDEDLVDLSNVTYTDSDYEDAENEIVTIHHDSIMELTNSVHTIGSELWKAEATKLFLAIQERINERAQDIADDRYIFEGRA